VRLNVAPEQEGERLDALLAGHLGSRTRAQRLIAAGQVLVDGTPARKGHKLRGGEVLDVDDTDVREPMELGDGPPAPHEVVWEDEHLLVVDKPAGLVVHPGAGQARGTLVQGLLARYPELAAVGEPDRPGIVHRLDKGTSGLLLVARTDLAHERLVAALSARLVSRRYRALGWGLVEAPRGLIDAPIGRSARAATRMAIDERGKEARTRYEVLARYEEPVAVTELACTLETGRTHQIRVHLRSIGHAVVGDAQYGGARQSLPMDRPFLHAEHLGLDHPVTGEALAFTSPLPADLVAVLASLR
jgi:23S rRNA pseudouridine1911/1915/1917 synthase